MIGVYIGLEEYISKPSTLNPQPSTLKKPLNLGGAGCGGHGERRCRKAPQRVAEQQDRRFLNLGSLLGINWCFDKDFQIPVPPALLGTLNHHRCTRTPLTLESHLETRKVMASLSCKELLRQAFISLCVIVCIYK